MSDDINTQITAAIQPAIDTIDTAAASVAKSRAQKITQISGGAIQTTSEQLTSMTNAAKDEMVSALCERVRDVANEYVIEITHPIINQGA